MYKLWWTKLTTYGVSASLEAVICQMYAKEMIGPSGGVLGTRIKFGGWI